MNLIDLTAAPPAGATPAQAPQRRWSRHANGRANEQADRQAGGRPDGRTDERTSGRADGRPITPPRIAGLAVSDSEETLTQREVLDRLGLAGDEFAERIFAHSRIERRHLNLSEELLARTSQGRAHEVEDELLRHSVSAIQALGVDLGRVGSIVSSSLYSLGLPTLAHRLAEHFELDPTIDKYHVTGVGCASAVPLMRMAAGSLHQHPGRDSLIVAAESMSSILMPGSGEDPRAKTVGSAIFGDGCAAALLSGGAEDGGPAIVASRVHQIGGTLDAVALSFAPDDGYLHLARELPDLAGAGLPGVVERFLGEHHVEHDEIDHWIIHPGGRRIIENIRDALALTDEQIALAWDTLASHGNVGTPSIFYVLHDTIAHRDPQPGQRGLAVTIGPGVTVGLMLLRW